MSEAKIVSDKSRFDLVELEWPVEYKGKLYSKIMLKRLTVKELADWQKSLADKKDDEEIRMPLFRDEDGGYIPEEVWEGMDVNDVDMLGEKALPFLPKRFAGLTA